VTNHHTRGVGAVVLVAPGVGGLGAGGLSVGMVGAAGVFTQWLGLGSVRGRRFRRRGRGRFALSGTVAAVVVVAVGRAPSPLGREMGIWSGGLVDLSRVVWF